MLGRLSSYSLWGSIQRFLISFHQNWNDWHFLLVQCYVAGGLDALNSQLFQLIWFLAVISIHHHNLLIHHHHYHVLKPQRMLCNLIYSHYDKSHAGSTYFTPVYLLNSQYSLPCGISNIRNTKRLWFLRQCIHLKSMTAF